MSKSGTPEIIRSQTTRLLEGGQIETTEREFLSVASYEVSVKESRRLKDADLNLAQVTLYGREWTIRDRTLTASGVVSIHRYHLVRVASVTVSDVPVTETVASEGTTAADAGYQKLEDHAVVPMSEEER